MSVKLRQWRWSDLPVYNGFTHDERVRGWQAIWWMIDQGRLAHPTVCTICGETDLIQMHSENYYEVQPYGINQTIHMALHQRFKRPDAWRRIVDQYAVTGSEWFATLSATPVDLAADLRRVHGEGVRNVFTNEGIPSDISIR